jgi:hypothetical protein
MPLLDAFRARFKELLRRRDRSGEPLGRGLA